MQNKDQPFIMRSAKPIEEGSEDHTAWVLKFGTIDNWWKQLHEEAAKQVKLNSDSDILPPS